MNHFIEVDEDEQGVLYLVIHTGSRNIGSQVATYHSKIAENNKPDARALIARLKAEGRAKDIQRELKKLSVVRNSNKIPFVSGAEFDNYVHDMKIMTAFADANRFEIFNRIDRICNLDVADTFTTRHNYIDFTGDVPIMRKGAVSAKLGERVLIPFDQENGAIIGVGKGNTAWGDSAPHGSGRLMSRREAKDTLNHEDTARRMKEKGIYTTSVNIHTVDESSGAYKDHRKILEYIEPTVTMTHRLMVKANWKSDAPPKKRGRRRK